MDRWRVGEDRGSKEMDGCPLTAGPSLLSQADPSCIMSFMLVFFSWMPI
jgi:hypothetical protein